MPGVKWVEGVAIIVAVFLVVVVGSVNDYQKEKQFRKLNAKKDDRHVNVSLSICSLLYPPLTYFLLRLSVVVSLASSLSMTFK